MIPKVAGRGHSFKGLTAYLLNNTAEHEPDADSRVAWTATGNLLTNDIEKAAKVMAWTEAHADDLKRAAGISTAGAKPKAGGVYHYSLAWAIGEEPDADHMKKSALETLDALGLSEHEFFMVAHNDRPHRHVHIAVNLTHPETGKRAELGRDYVALQKWALDYERQHGVHCQVRQDNAAKRGEGKGIKHQNQKQDYATAVTRAFYLSDDGKSFVAALENEGLQLAKSRRGQGFVIVDEAGDIQKLGRQLDIDEKDKAKTAAIAAKMEGYDRNALPDADELAKKIKSRLDMAQRETEQLAQEISMLDAADLHAREVEKKEQAEEAEAKRRGLIFGKRRAQLESRHAAKILEVQQRHKIEGEKLESALDSAFSPRLEQIKNDAQQLQGIVDGKGLRLALRRVWRGKKDRAILDDLKQEIHETKNRIAEERTKLADNHRQEVADLEQLHRQRVDGLKEQIIDRGETKRRVYEKPGFADKKRKSNLGLDGRPMALDTAARKASERVRARAYYMQEQKRIEAEKAHIQNEMERQRPQFEERQQEIKDQSPAQSSDSKRSRLEKRYEQLDRKSKGMDYDNS